LAQVVLEQLEQVLAVATACLIHSLQQAAAQQVLGIVPQELQADQAVAVRVEVLLKLI
jgi:hypothetical protein